MSSRAKVLLVVASICALLITAAAALAAQTYGPNGSFSGPGTDPGQLSDPKRAAVEQSTGNLFVADMGNGEVDVFEPNGDYLTSFGATELDAPYGIAISEGGGETTVYVSDGTVGKVQRFDSDEAVAPSFTLDAGYPGPAGGSGPEAVGSFAAPIALAPNGDLWIADPADDLLQRFTSSGVFVSAIDGSTSPEGAFTKLIEVAVDSQGRVYAIDVRPGENFIGEVNDLIENSPEGTFAGGVSRVERFAADATHQLTLADLSKPATVSVDPATDEVAVSANQDAVNDGAPPSLHVFDESGARLYLNRMGPGTTNTTVKGLAFESSTPRIWSVNDTGYWNGGPNGAEAIHRFGLIELPSATIEPVADATYTTATFKGSVDPKGQTTNARFEVSKDGGASWETAPNSGDISVCEVTGPGECEDPLPVELQATGLSVSTNYLVRIKALIPSGAGDVSATESFATEHVDKPTVTLDPVSGVTGEEAHFQGSFNPNKPPAAPQDPVFDTTYRFECTPSCPNTPEPQTIPGDDQVHPVEFDAKDLEPNTAYEVRLYASNAAGEEVQVQSFTTAAIGPSALVGTVGALTHNSARLTAYVDANNADTTVTFEYDENAGFTSPTVAPSGDGTTIVGNGNKVAYADISGLSPETTYHWRVSAENAEGSDADTATRAFTTWPAPGPDQGGVGVEGRRELELVSEPKIGEPVTSAMLSASANRVLYQVWGGADNTTYGERGTLLAERTASGWKSSNPMPPRSVFTSRNAIVMGADTELTSFAIRTGLGLGPSEVEESTENLRWTPDTGELIRGATAVSYGGTPIPAATVTATSADARRMYSQSSLDPGGPPRIYEWLGSEEPVEVSLMPGDVPPACGVAFPTGFLSYENGTGSQNWLSPDGERLLFHSEGDVCDGTLNLYLRQGGADGSTTLISGPPLSGDDFGASFVQATDDGTEIFFTTATKLDPDDANETKDIYRHTIGAGNECVTCVVAEADVSNSPASDGGGAVAVSADGNRAYFNSPRALVPAARGIGGGLYVWRDGEPDSIGLVGPLTGLQTTGVGMDAIATPDGETFVFRSTHVGMDILTGRSNWGGPDVFYRYDDREGTLTCLSCPDEPSGKAGQFPGSVGFPDFGALDRRTMLVPDGDSYFFASPNPLLAADVNGTKDVYEWHRGQLGLLTDGRSEQGKIYARDASADGRSIAFLSTAPLTPDAYPGATQLYVARIGGGFDVISPPAPCGGEGCRGPQAPTPVDPGAGTPSFVGPGDPRPKPPCRKGKVRKRGNCVKKKKAKQRSAKGKKRASANRGGSK